MVKKGGTNMSDRDWNSLIIRGEVVKEPVKYYETSDEVFYLVKVETKQRGKYPLEVGVKLSDRKDDLEQFVPGAKIFVKGTMITKRVYDEILEMSVIDMIVESRVISFLEENERLLNSAILEGYIIQKGRVYQNKAGTDCIMFMVASNRDEEPNPHNYFRCLAQNERAHAIDSHNVGEKINIHGNIVNHSTNNEYRVNVTWISGFDTAYRNKDGYLFGTEETE